MKDRTIHLPVNVDNPNNIRVVHSCYTCEHRTGSEYCSINRVRTSDYEICDRYEVYSSADEYEFSPYNYTKDIDIESYVKIVEESLEGEEVLSSTVSMDEYGNFTVNVLLDEKKTFVLTERIKERIREINPDEDFHQFKIRVTKPYNW